VKCMDFALLESSSFGPIDAMHSVSAVVVTVYRPLSLSTVATMTLSGQASNCPVLSSSARRLIPHHTIQRDTRTGHL